MRKSTMTAVLCAALIVQIVPATAQRAHVHHSLPGKAKPSEKTVDEDRSKLADAAIVALIIAASIALYKSSGKPCACPSDTMKNGASCGNRSAWAKPGGARPLCFLSDVSADMIKAYRATKAIPSMW